MADIATVLKKTIDGLPTNNPDIRQKVYAKARASILTRLETKDPKPEQAAIDKQMAGVDRIIAAVESEYAFSDQVDDVLGGDLGEKPAAEKTPPPATTPAPPVPQPAAAPPPPPRAEPAKPAVDPSAPDFQPEQTAGGQKPPLAPASQPSAEPAYTPPADTRPRRSTGPVLRMLAWAATIVLVVGAGGYAAWTNQDYLRAQLAKLTVTGEESPSPATPMEAGKSEEKTAAKPAEDTNSKPQDQAAAKQ